MSDALIKFAREKAAKSGAEATRLEQYQTVLELGLQRARIWRNLGLLGLMGAVVVAMFSMGTKNPGELKLGLGFLAASLMAIGGLGGAATAMQGKAFAAKHRLEASVSTLLLHSMILAAVGLTAALWVLYTSMTMEFSSLPMKTPPG